MLDTNVIVSAAISGRAPPGLILEAVLRGEIQAITCPSVIEEYRAVLKRPRFRKWECPPIWLDSFILESIQLLEDPNPWSLPGPDLSDLVFLALASSQSAALVTGNSSDYPSTIRRGTEVLSPREYISWLAQAGATR